MIDKGCVPGGTRQNLETARGITVFQDDVPDTSQLLLADAQTSGGLLLCVPPRRQEAVLAVLKTQRTACATVIGRIVRADRPSITVLP